MIKPVLRHAFHALFCLLAVLPALAAPLEILLVGPDGKGVAGAVLALRSTDATRPLAPAVQASMDQQNLTFVPHVLVVPSGSRVVFPNSDKVSHQVYSFSPTKRFQLPLYSGRPYPPETFATRGVVTLGCNIHDQMRAYVYVVEAQYFGRTDATGVWKSPDVTAGEYTVQAWHPLARDTRALLETKLVIDDTAPRQTLRLAQPLKLRPASQIPANWDAY